MIYGSILLVGLGSNSPMWLRFLTTSNKAIFCPRKISYKKWRNRCSKQKITCRSSEAAPHKPLGVIEWQLLDVYHDISPPLLHTDNLLHKLVLESCYMRFFFYYCKNTQIMQNNRHVKFMYLLSYLDLQWVS